MKKVGIITLYNNNDNYGGLAQGMALQQFIEANGYDCKLINYRRKPGVLFASTRPLKARFMNAIPARVERILSKLVIEDISQRRKAFIESREGIPHTNEFNENTIDDCNAEFDIFVTGSDQVWRPCVVQDPYVLSFVKDKRKISYASSISQTVLSEAYGKYMRRNLSTYYAISVREIQAKQYLEGILKSEVEWVCDPVLLLDREEWLDKCKGVVRQCRKPYVFSYVLGNMRETRRICNKIAQRKGLTQVVFPHVEGRFRLADINWGDEKIFSAGVTEFLALIRDADLIVTDSFHAAVFSIIFEKQFFVLPRKNRVEDGDMSSRLTSFLRMVGLENRLILKPGEIKNSPCIDYSNLKNEYYDRIKKSRDWLIKALK